MKTSFACIVSCCAGVLLTCGSAGAAVLYQTGFESPTFSPGVMQGQDGWIDNGSGNAVVQGSVAKSGTQAVLLRNTAQDFADHPLSATGAGTVFTVEADYLHSGANTLNTQSSLALYGDDERYIGFVGFSGGAMFFTNRTNVRQTKLAVANDVWTHLVLTVDFSTLTLSGTADGQSLGNPLPMVLPSSGPTAWTKVTLTSFQTTGETDTLHYWDNLVVSSAAVPEPTTAALLGGVALVAFRRRRAMRP